MPSYKVMTHSLAEQSANLADVFSAVPVLPLAKAKIRKQAREGLPVHPGMSVPTIASLVDGFILYRYGWWGSTSEVFSEKLLRQSFRESWNQRKVRLAYVGEGGPPADPIRGRSSTEPFPVIYYRDLTVTESGGKLTLYFEVVPVYADGAYPTAYVAVMRQTASQENLLGADITSLDSLNPFVYPASAKEISCEVMVRFSDDVPMPNSGETFPMFFDFDIYAVERPHNDSGNDQADVGDSVSVCTVPVQLSVTVP